MSWAMFWQIHGPEFWAALGQHIILAYGSVLLGAIVAVPLGIYLARRPKAGPPVISLVSILQTIPSLALLGFALPVLGIGMTPAIAVLFLYSLLPILRNTYTAIRGVDPAMIEAGRGMGMSQRQLLFRVELPLSQAVIIAGIRVSTVYMISWATLAAFIGAGGLGDLIIGGLETYSTKMIIAGAVPAALLALISNFAFNLLERAVTPAGLGQRAPREHQEGVTA